ncbi:MAG: hypothetical protein KG075_23670 [Alphaproteobacteria bacterium]|nr:hypothetical protein [Alphaproteobacteria bacterium]
MASLRVVKGRLSAASEATIKNSVATWDWWRIIDDDGRDVMIKNVRALEFMRSHLIQDEEGTFVFTKDGAPWFIGFRYRENGHVADGWQEWKDRRRGFVGGFFFGLLLVSLPWFAVTFNWGQGVGLFTLFFALFGLLVMAVCGIGMLGNLLSYKPSKRQVADALGEAT